ncbi:isochorismatase family protein [Microbacterium sp. 1.5R]|uniref:isochorismatase family protein n=1 Tax=Microbacterium sp. 1.5R TaxID=1916917 RepID=UPI0011A53F35|nr:isochorismatase family protein [Microbacterium sp. 1.5R]
MPRTTLRQLNGFDDRPATLPEAVLVLVDYQNTYTTGVMELEGWRPALDAAANLLARAREVGSPVIHVVNDGGAGTPYDVHSEIGRIHDDVAPRHDEAVVVKSAPNAFVGTDLGELVERTGRTDVVIAGFMTNMCVTFTAEGAFLGGFRPTIVADACATRPLESAGTPVSALSLHEAALATIGDLYGVVVRTGDELT